MKKLGLFLIFSVLMSSLTAQGNWEKEYDEDGLTIYTRSVPDIKFREFKATTTFKSSLKACIAAFMDYAHHKDFMYSISDCQLVDRTNAQDYYLYYVVDFPWPYNDRDMITRITFKKHSDKLVTMKLASYPNKKAETDKVRMKITEGEWRFEQINSQEVKITYTNKSDPAGSVPAWLANMYIVNGPKDTLMGLKERVGLYANKSVSWLD